MTAPPAARVPALLAESKRPKIGTNTPQKVIPTIAFKQETLRTSCTTCIGVPLALLALLALGVALGALVALGAPLALLALGVPLALLALGRTRCTTCTRSH